MTNAVLQSTYSLRFIGSGSRADLEASAGPGALDHPIGSRSWEHKIGPWVRNEEGEQVPVEEEENCWEHPSGYIASPDLAAAVNTALVLRKPLLLTGNPGTGKSELAERIAWELNLGAVLRFEAQSLSEARDLFYRFDLVEQMIAAQMAKVEVENGSIDAKQAKARTEPEKFLKFGPLGKAILRSNPDLMPKLWPVAFPHEEIGGARPSVVLIDEIDKAGRDFPNDLLNGIQRLEFRIREVENSLLYAKDDDSLRPIVIITSNSERDLPAPFLRRCVYFNIEDPSLDSIRKILAARVLPELKSGGRSGRKLNSGEGLPVLLEEMLQFFDSYQKKHKDDLIYRSGVSELLDWARAVSRNPAVDHNKSMAATNNSEILRATRSVFAKHPSDIGAFVKALNARLSSAVA